MLPALVAMVAAAVTVLFCACTPRSGSVVYTIRDTSFAAIHPALAKTMDAMDTTGISASVRTKGAVSTTTRNPETLVRDIETLNASGKRTAVIVASPLVVSALASTVPDFPGMLPPIVTLDWSGQTPAGLNTVDSDRSRAYALAGRAAGIYVATLTATGRGGVRPLAKPTTTVKAAASPEMQSDSVDLSLPVPGSTPEATLTPAFSPACGIIFAETASRPAALLRIFSDEYEKALRASIPTDMLAGQSTLYVETVSAAGSTVDFVDFDGETAVAVQTLLKHDIRLIFFACGRTSVAARTATAKPELVIGLDGNGDTLIRGIHFQIMPDERTIARKLDETVRKLLGDPGHSNIRIAVPVLLKTAGRSGAGGSPRPAFMQAFREAGKKP